MINLTLSSFIFIGSIESYRSIDLIDLIDPKLNSAILGSCRAGGRENILSAFFCKLSVHKCKLSVQKCSICVHNCNISVHMCKLTVQMWTLNGHFV